ncbi:hypothetical protein DFP73DRAFT_599720 [Morchella snyderi]|nr:hypothetical protein DFP73DRAFT_599720 [Morchella snyderi]
MVVAYRTHPSSSPVVRRDDPYTLDRPGRHSTVSLADQSCRELFRQESPTPNVRDSQETLGRSQQVSHSRRSGNGRRGGAGSCPLQRTGSSDEESRPSQRQMFAPEEFMDDEEEGYDDPIVVSSQRVDRTPAQWTPASVRRTVPVGEAEEEEAGPTISVPTELSPDEAQRVLDVYIQKEALAEEEQPRKRTYDKSKFAGLYPDTSHCVWGALNRRCRMAFARYLTIPDSQFTHLIDISAARVVKRNTPEFTLAWDRMLQWRKNWLREYNRQAKDMWGGIIEKPECAHYLSLDEVHLRTIYASHWCLESWFQLMIGSTSAFVDCRSTLLQPEAENFYKTVSVYTMIYTHMLKLNKLDREACNQQKPVHKTRLAQKKKPAKLAELDPLFVPFDAAPAAAPAAPAAAIPIDPTLTSVAVLPAATHPSAFATPSSGAVPVVDASGPPFATTISMTALLTGTDAIGNL